MSLLVHVGRVVSSVVREKLKGRSPKWSSVRKKHLKDQPACVSCGSIRLLQVHHIVPFSDRPDLELDPNNLVTLCMSRNECHLHIGHGGGYEYFNPKVLEHSAIVQKDPKHLKDVWALARIARRDKP